MIATEVGLCIEAQMGLFGGTREREDGVDRTALAAMQSLFRSIDDDLKRALANEMANRYDPMERVILAGWFVAACWMLFWSESRRERTVAAFAETARQAAWEAYMRMPVPLDGPPATRQDVFDTVLIRAETYESCFALDMERAKHFKDLPVRLAETSEGAARFVFPAIEDRERGARMLLARLHSYFRSTMWRIEHQDAKGI